MLRATRLGRRFVLDKVSFVCAGMEFNLNYSSFVGTIFSIEIYVVPVMSTEKLLGTENP